MSEALELESKTGQDTNPDFKDYERNLCYSALTLILSLIPTLLNK